MFHKAKKQALNSQAFLPPQTACPHLNSSFTPSLTCTTNPVRYRPRSNLHMLSAASLTFELISAAAIAGSTYYFFIREESLPVEEDTEDQPSDEGIVGLSKLGPKTTTTLKTATPITPALEPQFTPPETPSYLQIDTVGVDINDYIDEVDASQQQASTMRVEEELKWASGSIMDIEGCETIVVIDTAGDVIWVEGDLVSEDPELGLIPRRVGQRNQAEVLDVTGNEFTPFLKEQVRSVAILPVGIQGATLVIASRQNGFFGSVEKRMAEAICSRLSTFLFIAPENEE